MKSKVGMMKGLNFRNSINHLLGRSWRPFKNPRLIIYEPGDPENFGARIFVINLQASYTMIFEKPYVLGTDRLRKLC